jgi:alkyl hydroperoxide reductase subunit AhpF
MFKRLLLRLSNTAILIPTMASVNIVSDTVQANNAIEKVVIIGSGPAGHTAAIYSNFFDLVL